MATTLRAFYLPIARDLRARDVRVHAFARGASFESDLGAVFERRIDAPWSRSPLNLVGATRAARLLRQLVAGEGYCLVHVATPIAAAVTRTALRNTGIPVVYTAHGFHFHSGGNWLANSVFRLVEAVCSRWTRVLMVINREDFLAARTSLKMAKRSVVLIPGPGVDPQKFAPSSTSEDDRRQVCASLGLPPGARFFLVVGEFIKRKRHGDVIEAISLVSDGEFWVAFAGTGPLMNETIRSARRRGVDSRCLFLGFRSDIPQLMRAAFGVLLASSQEGLPTCVIEAMATGLPVIASSVRGSTDLVGQGCGLMYPVGDVQALASAIRWALDHPSEFAALGSVGVGLAPRYSVDRVRNVHRGVYALVCERLRTRMARQGELEGRAGGAPGDAVGLAPPTG